MSNRLGKNLVLSLALLCIIALSCGSGSTWAAEGIASFKTVSGTVDVLRGGKLPAQVVKAGDSLSEGDFVRTRSGSFAEIQFKDGTVLKVAQRSRIDIAAYFSGQQKNGANVRLPRGKVEAIVEPARAKEAGKGRRFEVHTPNAVAGVRGTDFIVSHERNLTGVFVRRGSVYTYNRQMPDRIVTVNAGNITTITPGAPPQTPRPALPSETQRMEKGMSSKGTNGTQSGAQNGSQAGQPAQTSSSQSTSQTDSQAASQTEGQSLSQPGSQTAGTTTIGTQTVDSSGNGSAVASDPLPVITTTFASTTTSAAASGTAPVISTDTISSTGPLTSAAAPTTVLLPPPTPPPVVSPLPTNTNVNVNVNFPPTPPPIPPPPSTNVNVNVNF